MDLPGIYFHLKHYCDGDGFNSHGGRSYKKDDECVTSAEARSNSKVNPNYPQRSGNEAEEKVHA